MATSNVTSSSNSSVGQRKLLQSYDISLIRPYSFPAILEVINDTIKKKVPCIMSYEPDENWLRIRAYIPITPATTSHSALSFGWETHGNSRDIQCIADVCSFCLKNEALLVFSLHGARTVLHIDIYSPGKASKRLILQSYFE